MIALADLAEAEGRSLRYGIARVGGALALLTVSAVMLLAGLGFWLWGIYALATQYIPAPSAAALTGLFAVVMAGVVLWLAARVNR